MKNFENKEIEQAVLNFKIPFDTYIKLKLKLDHNKIKLNSLIEEVLTDFCSDDQKYKNVYKNVNSLKSFQKKSFSQLEKDEEKKIEKYFNISEKEINEIYDFLEKEEEP
jgi:predicted HicB family RNase H-like nuclease